MVVHRCMVSIFCLLKVRNVFFRNIVYICDLSIVYSIYKTPLITYHSYRKYISVNLIAPPSIRLHALNFTDRCILMRNTVCALIWAGFIFYWIKRFNQISAYTYKLRQDGYMYSVPLHAYLLLYSILYAAQSYDELLPVSDIRVISL